MSKTKYEYRKWTPFRSKTGVLFHPDVYGQCLFCRRVLLLRTHVEKLPAERQAFRRQSDREAIEVSGYCSYCQEHGLRDPL